MTDHHGGRSDWTERPIGAQELASAPDDVLDDHLWLRVLHRLAGPDRPEPRHLPEDVRAWYSTRLFEWETGSGGPDAFWDNYSDHADLVSAGYSRLGLVGAAEAFDRLRSSPLVRRLIDDPGFIPSDDDLAALTVLSDAIGRRDTERTAFVRAHPESFVDL